jgi:hypothetical protein
MARAGSAVGAFGRFLLGFLFGLIFMAGGLTIYFKYGKPPVAVVDHPFPFEKALLRHPVNLRIDRELTGPPFGATEDVFEAGAHIYMAHCVSCHGTPDHDSTAGRNMYPRATRLWKRGGQDNAIGVTEIETGRSYWKVAHGIRLTGMPAYSNILTETQMWQVTLLLKHADKMPEPVMVILKQ